MREEERKVELVKEHNSETLWDNESDLMELTDMRNCCHSDDLIPGNLMNESYNNLKHLFEDSTYKDMYLCWLSVGDYLNNFISYW